MSKKNRVEPANIFILLSAAYFIFQVTYFALNINPGLPPDEGFHVKQSIIFALSPGIFPPLDTLDAWHGTDSRTFILYHLLMGKALVIADYLNLPLIYFLRFVNILLGIIYIFIFYRLSQLLLKNKIQIALAMFVHSTILMFVFLYGSVNHDNLVNLISIASIYIFLRIVVKNDNRMFLWLLFALGIGGLTKNSFLPLGVILLILSLWVLLRQYSVKEILLPNAEGSRPVLKVAPLLLAAIVVMLNVFQHGNTYLKYGSIDPSCNKIYSTEKCMQQHAIFNKYSQLKQSDKELLFYVDPVRYFVIWGDYMLEKTLGIFAYSSYYQGKFFLGVTELILVIAALIGWKNGVWRDDKALQYTTAIIIVYALILCYFVNYRGFLFQALMPRYSFVGIQGRYLFPVISLVIILTTRMALSFSNKTVNNILALAIAGWLGFYGFPSFLSSKERLTPNNILQNTHIKQLSETQRFKYP